MKKIIVLLLICLSVNLANAKPIEISYENGIYHIVLSGDKIKKRIEFVASESLMTNKEAHVKGR